MLMADAYLDVQLIRENPEAAQFIEELMRMGVVEQDSMRPGYVLTNRRPPHPLLKDEAQDDLPWPEPLL